MAEAGRFTWDAVASMAKPTDPAAGNDWSYTVPTGKRLYMIALTCELTSSAAAANRQVRICFRTSGSKDLYIYPAAAVFSNQTASRTNSYTLGVGCAASDAADQVDRTGILPDHWELPAGTVISTSTTNIQGADQWVINWVAKLMNA